MKLLYRLNKGRVKSPPFLKKNTICGTFFLQAHPTNYDDKNRLFFIFLLVSLPPTEKHQNGALPGAVFFCPVLDGVQSGFHVISKERDPFINFLACFLYERSLYRYSIAL